MSLAQILEKIYNENDWYSARNVPALPSPRSCRVLVILQTQMKESPNGYSLSRNWFDFSFDNPEKIRPIHAAIYFFAIEHNNRLGWREKFGFPTEMAMSAIGVKNWRTYSAALNDLEEWGFINFVERSKNQYSANIISLFACVKNTVATTKALDKAMQKHLQKHSTKHSQSTVVIDKHINLITLKHINKETGGSLFDSFWKEYPKKVGKGAAENSWKKIKAPKTTLEEILKALEWQKKSEAWTRDGGQYVPNPATYLNQRRWEDEKAEPVLSDREKRVLGII